MHSHQSFLIQLLFACSEIVFVCLGDGAFEPWRSSEKQTLGHPKNLGQGLLQVYQRQEADYNTATQNIVGKLKLHKRASRKLPCIDQ